MDQQKLRSLVFEKTGIKIDTSDPVFAVVAMNEALLEEAVQRHLLVLEQSSQAILQQLHALRAQQVPQAAGASASVAGAHDDIWENSIAANSMSKVQEPQSAAAQAVDSNAASASAAAPAPAASATAQQTSPQAIFLGQLRIAALTALMTVVLLIPSLNMFGARNNSAPTLTPQQENQVKQAEKLQKILPTLDAKTRSQIEAALQK